MKPLGRILIILIAAFVVIGATYALSQTTAVSTLIGQPQGMGELAGPSGSPDWANGASGQPGAVNSRPEGGPEGRGGSWETVGRNLLYIAAIVVAVQVLWSSGRRLKRAIASPARRNQLSPSRGS